MAKIGKRNITELLMDLAVANPNKVNPVSQGACVYDKKYATGIRHCIAGQLVRDLGYTDNLDFANTIEDVLRGEWGDGSIEDQEKFRAWLNKTFTPGALDILNKAQTVADGRNLPKYIPLELRARSNMPWKTILYVLPLTSADRNEVSHLL